MKYQLVKITNCPVRCAYSHYSIGSTIPFLYTSTYIDINKAMQAADRYNNDPGNSCQCQVEVREVE